MIQFYFTYLIEIFEIFPYPQISGTLSGVSFQKYIWIFYEIFIYLLLSEKSFYEF